MIDRRLSQMIINALKASPNLSGDALAELVERYASSVPILGHLALQQMVDDGQIQIDESSPELRYTVSETHPSD